MSITITFSDEEASAIEVQLRQIEVDRCQSGDEKLKVVRKHLDRLEGGRIRFTQAIQEACK